MPEAETDACVKCGRLLQVGEIHWVADPGEADADLGDVTYCLVTYCLECYEREFGELPEEPPDDGKEFWERESGWILVRLSNGDLGAVNTEPGNHRAGPFLEVQRDAL